MWFLLACNPNNALDTGYAPSDGNVVNASQRYVLTTLLYQNKSGRLFVYDRQSQQEVWRLENEAEPVWQDARLNYDSTAIVHNVCDVVNHDFNQSFLLMIDREGQELKKVAAPGSHHSIDVLDRDVWATIEYNVQNTPQHGDVAGDSIVIYRSGIREEILNTFDVINPSPITEMWDHGFFPNAHDWTHTNAIRWLDEQQQLLLTIPGINALWRIGLDGLVKTVYLGQFADPEIYQQGPMYQQEPYEIVTGGTFDMPHGASMDSQGRLWIMSNGLGNDSESAAHGYEIIDGQLELFRKIPIPIEGARTPGLGSVTYLEESETVLINWGIIGILEEVNAQNQAIWQIQTNLGEALGMSTTSATFPLQ